MDIHQMILIHFVQNLQTHLKDVNKKQETYYMNKFPIFYLQLSNEFVSFVQNELISSGEYP